MKDRIKWVKDNIFDMIVHVTILAIILIALGCIIAGAIEDNKIWNDGRCSCGGKWQYIESDTMVRGSNGNVTTYKSYVYRCDRCGALHEFSTLR